MEKLTQSDLIDALARVGISKGDKLLVHSFDHEPESKQKMK